MWIIPKTSQFYHFVPDTVDLTSDCIERWADHCESLLWRSKPSQRRTWLQRLKKASWLSKLCTRILKPSRQSDFLDALTSSLRATRASRSALPASEKVSPTRGISGRLSEIIYSRLDLFTVSLRTWQDIYDSDSIEWSEIWMSWVIQLRLISLRRRRLALRTNESGCLSWLTPRASEPCENPEGFVKRMGDRGEHCHGSLSSQAVNWPTPVATFVGDSPEAYRARQAKVLATPGNHGKSGITLETKVNEVNWATPRANDAEKRGQIANDPRNGLPAQTQWPTPQASEYKGMSQRGVTSPKDRLTNCVMTDGLPAPDKSNATGKSRGQLNPKWVSQLMGLPVGWTNVYSKGDIDADNKMCPCKSVCLLWQDPDSQEIQRTIRRFWGVSSPEVLREKLLQIERNTAESKQDDPQEAGLLDSDGEMQPMPCDDNPATSPPRYCQLRRGGNSLPEMPRTLTYCKWNVGKGESGKSRVDELRLLGNGVVPAQAELAFRTLWETINS